MILSLLRDKFTSSAELSSLKGPSLEEAINLMPSLSCKWVDAMSGYALQLQHFGRWL
ncbi:hypothetical protein [Burkholderia sp. Bp8963]|uniref:hypothetical protein n=1 Tax=Burkholderia sp. Bp8963 TaxID=2184547 RepID=UPI00163A4076|nr:hypothetical protein [Burkholderia sp. Bp8963]